MTDEKTPEGEPRLATAAQWKLCEQLYEETHWTRTYDKDKFMALPREDASRHIAAVKERKVSEQGMAAANETRQQFDKIGFGMIYKLFWNAASEQNMATKFSEEQFIDAVIGEYKLFKGCQKACRQYVEDGGLK